MVFSTQIFLFIFFPICLVTYVIADKLESFSFFQVLIDKFRVKDMILILFSFGFYMWTCFDNVYRFAVYILVVYLVGIWIHRARSRGNYIKLYENSLGGGYKPIYLCLLPFLIGIGIVVFILIYYNYSNFLIFCWNQLLGDQIASKSLITPLGVSFITFSAISYLADIYRGKAEPGSFIDCTLYLSFFPKLVSGPIVLWKDFRTQVNDRSITVDGCVAGINRIMIGFAKKVILADTFGTCLAKISLHDIDAVTAFGTIVLYMLQIYYDFSGYSDIAIGISKLFGFHFNENFNFPYRSKSISEFWRRWHISLGVWFREYVYFPLGGSRCSREKTLRNLAIVFVLTGIWHGAGWNYILWGAINGAIVLAERIWSEKEFYKKIPSCFKYIATMLVVMLFWQLFKYQTVGEVGEVISIALGIKKFQMIPYTWQYFFDKQLIVFTIVGILGATVLGCPKVLAFYKRLTSTKTGYLLQEIFLVAVFMWAILFMVNSTYSPFIYFQF